MYKNLLFSFPKKVMRKFLTIILFFSIFCLSQCTEDNSTQGEDTPRTGEQLSKIYCTSCHMYPSPDLLDQKTWADFVLIRMGNFLGIYQDGNKYVDKMPNKWLEPGKGGYRVKQAKIYPDKPVISVEEWQKIAKFYLENAPATISGASAKTRIKIGIPFFKSKSFSQKKDILPVVQAMTIDSENKLVYATEFQGGMYKFNYQGKALEYLKGKSHIVDLKAEGNYFVTLDMASRYASDNPKGRFNISKSFENFRQKKYEATLEELMRPVNFTSGDLNGDEIEDYVIAEYGNLLGRLAWWEGKSGGKFKSHTLFPDDGAIKAEIEDLNGDGKNDIIALQANSDEGIDWYINEGNNKFRRERKLRFLPTNGSTHFQLLDFNGDDKKDILYSNGDNGDYPPILKPYHGIHLFLNKNDNYEESFFIPLNGVYQAEAVDFDQDGDLDVAAVSFHPDFQNHPQEAFVIFINDGENNFSAHTIPQFAAGRWMRFVTADLDGDKDIDILLSAMNIKTPEVPRMVSDKWAAADNAIVFLENTTK